jgi:hypothetical protein
MATLKNLSDYLNSNLPVEEYPCFRSCMPVNSSQDMFYFVEAKPVIERGPFRVFPCSAGDDGTQRKPDSVGLNSWQHLDDVVSTEFVKPEVPASQAVS